MDEQYQNSNLQNQGQPEMARQDDLAHKFLADALRASFVVLQVVMVAVLFFFGISGFKTIGPDEEGLVLTFGKIQGQAEQRILKPGLKWVWPYPIQELIRIPVAKKTNLAVDSLWYYQSPKEKLAQAANRREFVPPKLNPLKDGYSLTRSEKGDVVNSASSAMRSGAEQSSDYSIVHTKWQLTYQIANPELFFKNVYVDFSKIQAGQNYADVLTEAVTGTLKDLVADAVIATLVNYTIDEVLFEKIATITEHVKRQLQKKLDQIQCGIRVVSVQLDDKAWPRQVDEAFWASVKASNTKEKTISEAKTYAEKTSNETKGRVAEIMAQATAYRKTVVESAKASADYFRQLLPEYRKRPRLVLENIYQDAMEYVLDNVDEKMVIEPTEGTQGREIRIQINRDPTIKPRKESEKD